MNKHPSSHLETFSLPMEVYAYGACKDNSDGGGEELRELLGGWEWVRDVVGVLLGC